MSSIEEGRESPPRPREALNQESSDVLGSDVLGSEAQQQAEPSVRFAEQSKDAGNTNNTDTDAGQDTGGVLAHMLRDLYRSIESSCPEGAWDPIRFVCMSLAPPPKKK